MACSYPVAGFISPRPIASRCARDSAKVAQTFVLCPVFEHIAEARPSSSEFITGNRNALRRIRHCDRYAWHHYRSRPAIGLCKGHLPGRRERQIATDSFHVSGIPETWKSAKMREGEAVLELSRPIFRTITFWLNPGDLSKARQELWINKDS